MTDEPKIVPVILSGGSGTRLWPVSRPDKPKQFLPLTSADSMFQLTLRRVVGHIAYAPPVIVANSQHAALVEAQLAAKGDAPQAIILEPCARNTAPAIALAALSCAPDDVMLIMPADHVIADEAAFHTAVARALPYAVDGWMMTFGIAPSCPETGYGYIEMGDALGPIAQDGARRVLRFVEKPDVETAAGYLATGRFAWNGGIFLIRADCYLAALHEFAPDIHRTVAKAWEARDVDGKMIRPDAAAFAASRSDSIDYAVMERAERIGVVPVNMGWSDVGSWDALYDIGDKDACGNVAMSGTQLVDARGNFVWAEGLEVSLLGVDDLIVVVGDGKLMITRRGEGQRVKALAGQDSPPSSWPQILASPPRPA